MPFLHGTMPMGEGGGYAFCGKITPEIASLLANAPGGKPAEPAKAINQSCPLCQHLEHHLTLPEPDTWLDSVDRGITLQWVPGNNGAVRRVHNDPAAPPPGRAPPVSFA
nr:hypothetical protein [Chitinivorax sp. B]